MSGQFIRVSEGFWNIRGSFKIAGVIDVGTQASLVRLTSGKFVLIEAILNLHPFHTVHVRKLHGLYPHAALYGTARHVSRFPDLPWAKVCTEGSELHQRYAEDFDFSVPRGVEFIFPPF